MKFIDRLEAAFKRDVERKAAEKGATMQVKIKAIRQLIPPDTIPPLKKQTQFVNQPQPIAKKSIPPAIKSEQETLDELVESIKVVAYAGLKKKVQ